MKPFRRHHFLQICERYRASSAPLDLILRTYFRENSAVGSHDRKEICGKLYDMVRWQGKIDAFLEKPITDEKRLEIVDSIFEMEGDLPSHVQVSFPKHFHELLVSALGVEDAQAFCTTSNERAPTTLRTNLIKTDRASLLQALDGLGVACEHSPTAINLTQQINLFGHPLFKAGHFEVQDEASQIAAGLVQPKPGEHVLDYCAGAGGKSLAFAPSMKGRGQIYYNDVREHALSDAKKRFARAGIQNATRFQRKRHKMMDRIVLDLPCTGTGTLRRNPDQKWRFSRDLLDRMVNLQMEICEEAIPMLKPGGHLIYATCSVLPQENELQIKKLLERFPLEVEETFSTLPVSGGMDGFFATRLLRK